jgi:adenylate kinase family enzyme
MCHIVNTPKEGRFAVIMDGPVASGKGKQSRLFEGGVHISTGDLARKKRELCVKFDGQYGHILDTGKYLPDNVVFELVREHIPNIAQEKGIIIGDGLVRTRYQADQIGTIFARPQLMLGFSILIPLEVSLIRAQKRFEEESRLDDFNEKTILTRYENWSKNKESVHKKLRAKGVTIIEIDGNRSIEEVQNTIQPYVEKHVKRLRQEWEESSSYSQPKKRRRGIYPYA